MHMADALVSPAVGGAMWAVTAGLLGYCSRKVKKNLDDHMVPLMGVMGAFVFAAQMINFSIPATGSSGHLGGGLLLAILLGPHAAFLTLASILIVQALFFADGGILALGCNIFNMGFVPCLVAYPFLYRPLAKDNISKTRIFTGALAASIVGLQFGSLGVVAETHFSGVSDLPFATFMLFMQPIHLAIGVAEGLATASIVMFVHAARPEILIAAAANSSFGGLSLKKILAVLMTAAVLTGGLLSWFASSSPDGLEWSVRKTSGKEQVGQNHDLHTSLAAIQETTALLPDYGFKEQSAGKPHPLSRPAADYGATASGLIGGTLTFLLLTITGFFLLRRRAVS